MFVQIHVQPEATGTISIGSEQSAQPARVVLEPGALEIVADAEQVAALTNAQTSRAIPRRVVRRVEMLVAFANFQLRSPNCAANNG